MVKRPELMAASTQYDPTTGRYSQKEPERVWARRMTLAAIQRHWIVGSAVCVACIVCEDRIKDSYGRGDAANEPVGALLGVLGSIYGLCFAFAFQSSKQRILDLSVALTAEVSALTRLQLLSSTLTAEHERSCLSLCVSYGQQVARELKPDDWSFGNTLYAAEGRSEDCKRKCTRLFGSDATKQLRDLVRSSASSTHAAELRALAGELIDARTRRLGLAIVRMPLLEWTLLEAGTYIFVGLAALLDTGSSGLNRLCMGLLSAVLLALNHVVADANEPFYGAFKVKKTLLKHYLEAAEAAVAPESRAGAAQNGAV